MSFLHQINPLTLISGIQRRRPFCIYGVFHFNSLGSTHSADNGLLAGVCVSLYVCVSPFMQSPLSARQLLHTMECICRVSVSPSASRREISHCERRRLLSRRPICIQLGSARQLTRSANNNNRPECRAVFAQLASKGPIVCWQASAKLHKKERADWEEERTRG